MQPTEDERVLAALAHASIVANVANLAGMIATALIWTMQRERSAKDQSSWSTFSAFAKRLNTRPTSPALYRIPGRATMKVM